MHNCPFEILIFAALILLRHPVCSVPIYLWHLTQTNPSPSYQWYWMYHSIESHNYYIVCRCFVPFKCIQQKAFQTPRCPKMKWQPCIWIFGLCNITLGNIHPQLYNTHILKHISLLVCTIFYKCHSKKMCMFNNLRFLPSRLRQSEA